MTGRPEDALAEQATSWVVRLTSGETTPEDHRAFRRWRDESPAHAAALEDARRMWLAFGPALEPRQRHWALRIGDQVRIGAIAASIAACALITGHYVDVWSHGYVTGPGERRQVALSDGTKILLNGGSALDVDFAAGRRRVTLARGEAYFDVVHDAARPFSVSAGEGEVRDVGTAFSVRREGEGAAIVVARGSVEVDPAGLGARRSILTSNQALTYDRKGSDAIHDVNAGDALSWVQGRIIVENQSLSDSVREINRYYGGKLVVIGGDTGARRINAVIDLNRIDDWLAALDKTRAARVARIGPLVVLY